MRRMVYLCLPNWQRLCGCWKRGDDQDCGIDPDAMKPTRRQSPTTPAPDATAGEGDG